VWVSPERHLNNVAGGTPSRRATSATGTPEAIIVRPAARVDRLCIC
jgi:hypothetical protein